MKKTIWLRCLLVVCAVIVTLGVLAQDASAAETGWDEVHTDQGTELPGNNAGTDAQPEGTETEETETQPETEPEENDNSGILDAITSLPETLISGLLDAIVAEMSGVTSAAMDGITRWAFSAMLTVAETIFSGITASSSNIFNYTWFKVIVGLFSKFGMLLFAVGVVLAVVDVGVEYRRRGADIMGSILNLGKGMMAVGLFSTVPVPLFNFCVNIQHKILNVLSINWSFQNVIEAISVNQSSEVLMVIMLIIMVVLMFLVYIDSLKRGGILLVQICIGALHMLSVPRGYLDNFYSWCKQVVALCITVLLQNLLMFCGLMIVPSNLFLGIGTMFAAKEVPKICAQFGLDTSVKASFTNIAMGANASIQAVKALALLA